MRKIALAGIALLITGCNAVQADQADQAAAVDTRRVVIEDNPSAPPDPLGRCIGPMRIRNTNTIPVNVKYTMNYKGVGPGCEVEWNDPGAIGLARAGDSGSYSHLGCSKYLLPGGLCYEERRWKVDEATPAKR